MFLAPGKAEWVNILLCSYVQSNLPGFRYFGNKIQKGFSSFQQVLLNLVCTKLFSHQTNSVFFKNINFTFQPHTSEIESSVWVFSSLDSTTGLLSNILQMKRIVNNKEHNEPILHSPFRVNTNSLKGFLLKSVVERSRWWKNVPA